MNRWLALTTLTLAAGACARGGEADADAALTDTANSAVITGDTTALAPPPALDTTGAAMDMGHEGHTMDSAATDTTAATTGDSAAHP